MEQCTTYTVKHKKARILWEFKYDLKGNLRSFKVDDKPLSPSQLNFLFTEQKFPTSQTIMKEVWMSAKKSEFEIVVGEPDLSFTAFWNAYNHKIGKKKMAENTWNKMSRARKIKALLGIKDYDNYLSRNPGIQKAHATTYLNQEYYENEYRSAI
ncbi:hypothetical protein INR75_02905 [Zunongwangia sp. SCSIO 43204]|uniref:hypothetical protein n=1 Tax=Zunongwangia sp. SCSIO 43204 TaxID=2779359 RepID=UPI001CA86C5E|nr:hypothetical protein [Zunongwangia sp. SCSIO 43204]UAB84996.1 hypothetical protein INR75_02905 [Zunongwangia sp. SCSIO 43204]